MAEEPEVRTFTKKVGDETKTRTVHTASDEVAAKFDGFREDKPSTKKSSGASSSTTA